MNNDDVRSNYSRASKAMSIAASSKRGTQGHVDVQDLKIILGDGRNLGMSEEEWNIIVQRNVAAQKAEEERRKFIQKQQRDNLKEELQR